MSLAEAETVTVAGAVKKEFGAGFVSITEGAELTLG
jgi:hypothetical protein